MQNDLAKKLNLHRARGSAPKPIASGAAHFHDFIAVSNTASTRRRSGDDLTDPVIEPQTSRTDSVSYN